MRIVSLFVAFCFSLNVMASTGTIQQLESSLNDYQYSLSVEWDQKDQKFYDAKTQQFYASIEKLIKEDGLSKEQLLGFVELKVKNQDFVNALKLKMSLLSNGASAEELSKMVAETSKEMYAKGASWNGEIIMPVIAVLVIVAIVGYSYYWESKHECVRTESVYRCDTYNSCTGLNSMGMRDPYFYGVSNYDSSCISFPRTHCGYQNVCTEWVEKE